MDERYSELTQGFSNKSSTARRFRTKIKTQIELSQAAHGLALHQHRQATMSDADSYRKFKDAPVPLVSREEQPDLTPAQLYEEWKTIHALRADVVGTNESIERAPINLFVLDRFYGEPFDQFEAHWQENIELPIPCVFEVARDTLNEYNVEAPAEEAACGMTRKFCRFSVISRNLAHPANPTGTKSGRGCPWMGTDPSDSIIAPVHIPGVPEGYRPPCIHCDMYRNQRMTYKHMQDHTVPKMFPNRWRVRVGVPGEFCLTSIIYNRNNEVRTEGPVPVYVEDHFTCWEPEPGRAAFIWTGLPVFQPGGDSISAPLVRPGFRVLEIVDYEELGSITSLRKWARTATPELAWAYAHWAELMTLTRENLPRLWTENPLVRERVVERPLNNLTGWSSDEGNYPHHPMAGVDQPDLENYSLYYALHCRLNIPEASYITWRGPILSEHETRIQVMQVAHEPLLDLFMSHWRTHRAVLTDEQAVELICGETNAILYHKLTCPDQYAIFYPTNNHRMIMHAIHTERMDEPAPADRVHKELAKLGWGSVTTSRLLHREFREARKWVTQTKCPFTKLAYNPLADVRGAPPLGHVMMQTDYSIALTALCRIELCYRLMHRVHQSAIIIDAGRNEVYSHTDGGPEHQSWLLTTRDRTVPGLQELIGRVGHYADTKPGDHRPLTKETYFTWVADTLIGFDSSFSGGAGGLLNMSLAENRALVRWRLQSVLAAGIPSSLSLPGTVAPLTKRFLDKLKTQADAQGALVLLEENLGTVNAEQAYGLLYHELGARSFAMALRTLNQFILSRHSRGARRWRLVVPHGLRAGLFFELKQLVSTHHDLLAFMERTGKWTDAELTAILDREDAIYSAWDKVYPHPHRIWSESTLDNQVVSVVQLNLYDLPVDCHSFWTKAIHNSLQVIRHNCKTKASLQPMDQIEAFYYWIRSLREVATSAGYRMNSAIVPYQDCLAAYGRSQTTGWFQTMVWYTVNKECARHLILQYLFMLTDLAPILAESLSAHFPLFAKWRFSYERVFDDVAMLQTTSLRHHTECWPAVESLFERIETLQNKKKGMSAGGAHPSASINRMDTTTKSRKQRAAEASGVKLPAKKRPDPISIVPKIIEFSALPMVNYWGFLEDYCRNSVHTRDRVFRRSLHQVHFAKFLTSVFSEASKRPKTLVVVGPGEHILPVNNVQRFVSPHSLQRMLERMDEQKDRLDEWFSHYELREYGLSHTQCTYLSQMEQHFVTVGTPNKMLKEFFSWPSAAKYMVYAWLNLQVQVFGLQTTTLRDASLVAGQKRAVGRSVGLAPDLVSPNLSLGVFNTTSGKIHSGTYQATGPRHVAWNNLTKEFVSREVREIDYLIKKTHCLPRPLVSLNLIGKITSFPFEYYKTLRRFARNQRLRVCVGGDAAVDKVVKKRAQHESERRFLQALEEEKEEGEADEDEMEYTEGEVMDWVVPVLPVVKLARKGDISSMSQRWKDDLLAEMSRRLLDLREKTPIARKPERSRDIEQIPGNPSWSVQAYRSYDESDVEFRCQIQRKKKLSTGFIAPCCRNFVPWNSHTWGPWPEVWCLLCFSKEQTRRLLPVCVYCRKRLVRYSDDNNLTLQDLEMGTLRTFKACGKCASLNTPWYALNFSASTEDFKTLSETQPGVEYCVGNYGLRNVPDFGKYLVFSLVTRKFSVFKQRPKF